MSREFCSYLSISYSKKRSFARKRIYRKNSYDIFGFGWNNAKFVFLKFVIQHWLSCANYTLWQLEMFLTYYLLLNTEMPMEKLTKVCPSILLYYYTQHRGISSHEAFPSPLPYHTHTDSSWKCALFTVFITICASDHDHTFHTFSSRIWCA